MDMTNTQQQDEVPSSTKGRSKIWDLELVTDNEQEIAQFLKKWVLAYSRNKGTEPYKVYRCNQSKQKLSSKRATAKANLMRDRDRQNKLRAATQVNDECDQDKEEKEPQPDPCPCQVKLVKHQNSLKVSIYRSGNEHAGHVGNNRVDGELHDRVLELYESGVTKPSSIMHQLRQLDNDELVLTRIQLYYILRKIRLDKFGESNISLGELTRWLDSKNTPVDDETPFVLNSESGSNSIFSTIDTLDDDNDNEHDQEEEGQSSLFFRFLITSKFLLKQAIGASLVATDATHKLLWLGMPVLIVGTTDAKRQFHPFAIGVCTNETARDFQFVFSSLIEGVRKHFDSEYKPDILLADSAPAITNGFIKSAFGYQDNDFTRLNCWPDAERNLDKKIRGIKSDQIRREVKTDIHFIQLAHTRDDFKLLWEQFCKKWRSKRKSDVSNFIEYMEKNWILTNCNWYEGAAHGYPSSNDELESTYKQIKDSFTFRNGLPMMQFLELLMKIVTKWTQDRMATKSVDPPHSTTPARIPFYQNPPIDTALEEKAFIFASEQRKIHQDAEHDNHYYFCYSVDSPLTMAKVNQLKKIRSSKSFDDYVTTISDIGRVELADNWNKSKCLCSTFQKQYMCKHVLGLALRLNLVKVSSSAIDLAQGKKRKRGAQPKANNGRALIVD